MSIIRAFRQLSGHAGQLSGQLSGQTQQLSGQTDRGLYTPVLSGCVGHRVREERR
jgi:hypothetical protein